MHSWHSFAKVLGWMDELSAEVRRRHSNKSLSVWFLCFFSCYFVSQNDTLSKKRDTRKLTRPAHLLAMGSGVQQHLSGGPAWDGSTAPCWFVPNKVVTSYQDSHPPQETHRLPQVRSSQGLWGAAGTGPGPAEWWTMGRSSRWWKAIQVTSGHQPSLLSLLGFISAGESHSRWAAGGFVETRQKTPMVTLFFLYFYLTRLCLMEGLLRPFGFVSCSCLLKIPEKALGRLLCHIEAGPT